MNEVAPKNELVSADLIRMVYNVIQEATFGDTLMILYEDNDENTDSILILNTYTGKHLEYKGLNKYEREHNCLKFKDNCFIRYKSNLTIVDLKDIEEINSYENVVTCDEVNEYMSIIKTDSIILYNTIEQKEVVNTKLSTIGHSGILTKYINKNIIIASDINRIYLIYSIKENRILFENEVIEDYESTHNNYIIVQLHRRVIIYDTEKCVEVYNTKAVGFTKIDINRILIRSKDKIVIYSLQEHKVIEELQCNGTGLSWHKVIGKRLSFLGLGESGIILNSNNEVQRVINGDKYINAVSFKRSYCDMIILMNGAVDTNGYLDKSNYFICGNKIYTLEEYLNYLTIKNIEPVYEKETNNIKHYKITTNNGFKGTMSATLRNMSIKNLFGNENILDSRFDFIREKYLI